MMIRTGLAAVAGFAGGSLLAGFLVFGPLEIGGLRVGPWRTNLLIGDSGAGPVPRAIIARRGLLAMNRSEAVYFNTTTDDAGQRLDESCVYRVTFREEPESRWWSLTLYAQDDFLAVNGDNAASVTADYSAASAEDPMAVLVAPSHPDAPSYWMSSRNAGDFALTLRLYQPAHAIRENPALASLPSIERLSCGGGS